MKIYRGRRCYDERDIDNVSKGLQPSGHLIVTIEENGVSRPLDPRTDLANHSSTGFEWGYHGSGPAQLALAILADCIGEASAMENKLYQLFKAAVVASLPKDEWFMTEDQVRAAVRKIRSREDA